MGNSCKGRIKYDTDPYGSDFLHQDEINDVATSVKNSFNTSLENIRGKLDSLRRNGGLSIVALNIDNRAPLYELSEETVNNIDNINLDIEEIEGVIRKEGADHRLEEANTLLEKVEEEHKKYYTELEKAVTSYNAQTQISEKRYEKVGEGLLGKWDYVTHTHYIDPMPISVTSGPLEVATLSATPDRKSDHYSEVMDAKAQCDDFYNMYVKRAKTYLQECESGKGVIAFTPDGIPIAMGRPDVFPANGAGGKSEKSDSKDSTESSKKGDDSKESAESSKKGDDSKGSAESSKKGNDSKSSADTTKEDASSSDDTSKKN